MIEQKINISDYLSGTDFKYRELLELLSKDQKIADGLARYAFSQKNNAWRAVWVLYHYLESNGPNKLQKYAGDFVKLAKSLEQDGYLRETIKIINKLDLNEEQTCEMYDLCMEILWNNKKQASVRAVAFNFLLKTAEKYPELYNEIIVVFERIKEHLSQGIKKSMMTKSKMLNNSEL